MRDDSHIANGNTLDLAAVSNFLHQRRNIVIACIGVAYKRNIDTPGYLVRLHHHLAHRRESYIRLTNKTCHCAVTSHIYSIKTNILDYSYPEYIVNAGAITAPGRATISLNFLRCSFCHMPPEIFYFILHNAESSRNAPQLAELTSALYRFR